MGFVFHIFTDIYLYIYIYAELVVLIYGYPKSSDINKVIFDIHLLLSLCPFVIDVQKMTKVKHTQCKYMTVGWLLH